MINDSNITGTAGDFSGVLAYHDINFEGKNLNIKVTGADGKGVNAYKDAKIYIEGSTIIGTEENFTGVSAQQDNTQLEVNKTTIESQAKNGKGVTASSGAQISIEDSRITGTKENFLGLSAYLENTHLMGNKISITLKDKNGTGVDVQNGANTTINNSTLIGEGDHFLGLSAYGEDSTLTVNNLTMNAKGKNSKAVEVDKDAKVNIQNRSIITTEGASSPAMQLTRKGRLNISHSDIKTTGENSAIFYAAPGKSHQKSLAEMTGGSLEASGDLVLSEGGTMDVVLNKVSIAPPGSGYLLNVLNAGSGHSGEVNLSVFNPIGEKDSKKTLRGNIFAAEGSKASVTLNNSHLTGWAKATNMSIDPASQWSITGPSTVKQLKNEGKVQFQSPSVTSINSMAIPDYTTLSLERLSGEGMFWMNTDIAGHRGDFLNVTGKAEGRFGVKVTDSGQSPTADDSLKIIQTGGGDAKFTLANEGGVVDVGTYQYYLVPDDSNQMPDDPHRVLDDRKRGWSLVSHQSQIKTATKGTELNQTTPVNASSTETGADEIVTEGMIQPDAPSVSTSAPPPFISASAIASAQKTLFDDSKNHILRDSLYLEGIEVKNSTTVENLENNNQGVLLVSSSRDSKSAIKVSEGSTVTLKGAEEKLTTLTTRGTESHGIDASGKGTQVTASKIDITTHHDRSQGIKTDEGANVNIQNSTINSDGAAFVGLVASEDQSKLSVNKTTITANGQDSKGVKVEKGAKLDIQESTITGHGKNFYGLLASENKSKLNVNKTAITANSQDSKGIKAEKGAKVDVQDSTITGHGKNFYGLLASADQSKLEVNKTTITANGQDSRGFQVLAGAEGMIEDSAITNTGDYSYGLWADNARLAGKKVTIEVKEGQNSRGLKALNGAKATIKDSIITSTGDNFHGLWAFGDKTHLEGNNLILDIKEGQRGRGVTARNNAHVILNDSNITGTGQDFLGLSADGGHATLTVNNLTMNAKGKNSKAVEIDKGAQVNIQNGSVITTEGDFSPAIQLTQKGRLNVSNSAIKTLGKNSATFYVAPGSREQKSVAEMTGGSLEASGDLILSQGGTMDVVLNKVSVSSPGSGYLLNVLNSGSGQTGEINLILNQQNDPAKTLRGNIFTADGSKASVTLNNSHLTGWAKATNMSIDPASQWSVTGPSTLKHLKNEGKVQFQSPSVTSLNSMGIPGYTTVSLETLSGTGMFWMNTDIAGHQGDFLNVTRKAEGEFGVMVKDSGQSPRADDSLKIIQTGGGDAKFTLANEGGVVDVGTYQYYLVADDSNSVPDDSNSVPDDSHRVLDDRVRGWSLVSHQPQPSEKLKPESEPRSQTPVIPSSIQTVSAETPESGEAVMPESEITLNLLTTKISSTVTPVSGKTAIPTEKPNLNTHPEQSESLAEAWSLSPTAYNVGEKSGPISSKEKPQEKEKNIFDDGEHHILIEHGIYDQGIEIKKQSTVEHVENKGDLSVSTSNENSPAFKVSEGSTLTLKGISDKLMTVTTTGEKSSGLVASGTGTEVSAGQIHITTMGQYSEGVKSKDSAKVVINDSKITGTGENSYGLWATGDKTHLTGNNLEIETKAKDGTAVLAHQSARVMLNDSKMTGEGDSVTGVFAYEDNTNLAGKNLEIEMNGQNNKGIKAYKGATINIKDSRITGKGNSFKGILASEDKTNLEGKNLNIKIMGNNGKSVNAYSGATVILNNSSMSGEGDFFYGIDASDEKTNLTGNQLKIEAKGQYGRGLQVVSGAQASLNDSTIIGKQGDFYALSALGDKTNLVGTQLEIDLHGKDSRGVSAENGATVNLNRSTVTTSGALSPALWSKASTLKVSDSHIKTTGKNSPILYTENLDPTQSKSIVEITNGHLNASGDLIVSKGGLMDVTLNNVSILSPDNQNVLKVMNQGNVNLKANKTTLTGHVFADVDSQADLKLINESALIGQVNAKNLFIDPDSSWSMTGNSSLKKLHHEGDVKFQSHAPDLNETYFRLSLNNLNGHGTFWMNTDIAAQKGDFLNVTGEANGHFGVKVSDSGKNPKPGDTLQIIQTGGGNADFILANPGQVVDVGTYQYRLVPDDLKRGWSLMSHQSQSSSPAQQGQGSHPEPEVDASVINTAAVVTPISGEPKAPDVSEVLPESRIPTSIDAPVINTAAAVTPISGEPNAPDVSEVLPESRIPTVIEAPVIQTAAALTPISGEPAGPNLSPGQTPTLSESEPPLIQHSGPGGPNASIITISGQKNHTFKKKTYHQGIEIKGQSTVENTDALSVTPRNENTPAITVSEASFVNLDGAGDKSVTLKTSEINSPGLVASGAETEIRANKMDIITEGRHSHAVTSEDGAKVVINNSTIKGTGDRFYGLSANGNQTNLKGNQLQIQVKGKDGRGVSSQNGSTVMIDESSIIGEGDSFRGLLASGSRSHLTGNNLTIELQGKDGIGVKAQKGANVIIDDSTITGEGVPFRSLLPFKETSGQAGSKDTIGVVALSDATVSISNSNSTINGNGRYSLGLLASGEHSRLTGSHINVDLNAPDSAGVIAYKGATVDLSGKSTITTRGASSHAALLSEKSKLTITDSEIKTTGADSAILYGFTPDNPGEKSVAQITGGSLDASGDLILSKGGIMDVVLKNVSISSPGSGYALKALNNSKINLTVNQTSLPGSLLALNGSKIDMSLNGSDLVGGVTNVKSLTIDPDSRWSVTQNSVLGDLNHQGKIGFKSEGDTRFHRITANTLNGTGTFWMNTDIAGHKGDFLNVTGKARGHFDVMVSDSGQNPKPEDTLKIIQTGGGDAQFTLANTGHTVDVGTYKYYLVPDDSHQVPDDNHRVLDDRERGWSLVSHQPQIKTSIHKAAEPTSETGVTSSISPEVSVLRPVSGKTVTMDLTGPPSLSGSPAQAERMPESDRTPSVTFSSIETGVTGTPVSVATIDTPEVTQSPGLPIPQSVFLSSTAYNVDKIEPVLSKETIEGKENYILEEDYREGIEVKGQSTVTNSTLKNKKMLSVSSSHSKSPAVKASEGSTVTLNGNQDKLITVRTSGNQSPGMQASGINTNITADKINIMTEGKSSEGIKADAGGQVIINNSIITGEGENFNKGLLVSGAQSNLKGNNLAITINGDHGEGVIVEQGAEVTLEDSTINIEKDSVLNNGITASGQNTHLKGNKLTMNVNGINGRGVNVINGASVNVEDSSLTGKGTNFQGIHADGYGTDLTASKMNIEVDVGLDAANKIGAGVLATREGKIDIKDSTIIGKGTSFSVLRAEEDNAHLKGNNLTISVAGEKGTGVTAKNRGTAVINDSTITSTEEDFIGLVAQNNSNLTGKNITIDATSKNGSGVTALINSHVNIEDTTIIGKGENFLGLASVGENANMTAERMEIELEGQNVTGVTTVNGAKAIINHSNITEKGENAYGVLAAGEKSTLKADHLDIEANGGGSTGVKVMNGAKVILDDSDVTENGENAYGLSVEGDKSIIEANKVDIEVNASGGTGVKSVSGGTVIIEDSEMTGTAQDFLGILAHGDKSNLTAKKMTIDIKNKDSKAVIAEKGATVNIEDSRLISEGDTFVGLLAYQDNSKLTGTKLNIEIKNGQKGKAVVADKGAQASIENSTIISTGKNFLGLSASAEKSNLKAKKITMQVNGEQSKGAMAESGANLIIDDSTMIGNSTGFYGLLARGKNTNLTANNTNIALNGEDAKGITVENEATVNINGSTVTTHQEFSDVVLPGQKGTFKASDSHLKANGEGSAILYVEDPDNTKQKSVVEITRGSLESPKGSLMVSKGGVMDVVFHNVAIAPPGDGYALKVIHGGEVNLDVNQTTLPGNIFADPVSKANVTLRGSELIGSANANSFSIDPESTWSITGDSGWKSLSHTGKIQFKSDTGPSGNPITSNRYSRLSLESLSGTGMFWMNTDIAGHQGDFIEVTGEANGQFDVMVTDSGDSPKAGDTLKIIETGGGTADFILANPGQKVDVGTYQYYLVPDNLKRGWTLVSHQSQTETPIEQGAESNLKSPVTPSVTETETAATPVSGGTLIPEVTHEIQPDSYSESTLTAQTSLSPAVDTVTQSGPVLSERKRIFDDGQNHILAENSLYDEGIEVKNKTTVKNGGALSLSTRNENSPAVKVSEASTVILTGAEDKLVTLTTRGAGSDGLHALGENTQVTAHQIDITTHHDRSQGIKVEKGARVNIQNSTMTGDGEDTYGLLAEGQNTHFVGKHLEIKINAKDGTGIFGRGAQVTIEDSKITGTGDDFFGLVAQYTDLEGKNLEVDVKGKNGKGLRAFYGATVNINNSKMKGEGDSFQGIWAHGKLTHLTGKNLEIEAKSKNSKGVISIGSQVDIQESTITSKGDDFVGLMASEGNSKLTVNKAKIESNGQDGRGVSADKGAGVMIEDSKIVGTGKHFHGLSAQGEKTHVTGNQIRIEVKGEYGRGLSAEKGAELMIEDSTIDGPGENFYGLWVDKSTLTGKKLTIESKGETGRGVFARNEAHVKLLNESKIIGNEKNFVGLWSYGKNTHLTGNQFTIEVNGQNGKGGSAQTGSTLVMENGTMTSNGSSFVGLLAAEKDTNLTSNHLKIQLNGQKSKGMEAKQGAHLSGSHMNIELNAQDSRGGMALSGATLGINQSTITGKGDRSLGFLATGEKTNLTANQMNISLRGQNNSGVIVTKGAMLNMHDSRMTTLGLGSHAARLSEKGSLNVRDSHIKTLGENAAIVYVDSDNTGQKSLFEMSRGSLESSGDLIVSKGAELDVVLNNVAISSPGSGYALHVLNSDAGHTGHVNLVVNETTMPSHILTAKGSEAHVRLKRSELIGQVDATNLSIDADSRWTLTANSVLQHLSHEGKITFKPHNTMSSNQIKSKQRIIQNFI